jgi:hypothetical protein
MAPVGRFMGKIAKGEFLTLWMEEAWRPILGYGPVFHLLVRSWICFMVKSGNDAEILLIRDWLGGLSGLCLKRWKPSSIPKRSHSIYNKFRSCCWDFQWNFGIEEFWKELGSL